MQVNQYNWQTPPRWYYDQANSLLYVHFTAGNPTTITVQQGQVSSTTSSSTGIATTQSSSTSTTSSMTTSSSTSASTRASGPFDFTGLKLVLNYPTILL